MEFDPKLWAAILGLLLAISEFLPFFPKIQANGIIQAIVNFIKQIALKK